ncbi:thioredoxin-like 1-1, chloroplastic isoform X2 [Zingiber officinale]|nr:thioredoxin-like 1-1, chloroplastic isoform X2 [Zingiber officinale]
MGNGAWGKVPMAVSLRNGFCFFCAYDIGLEKREGDAPALDFFPWKSDFKGSRILEKEQKSHPISPIKGQTPMDVAQTLGWWQKKTAPNMEEVESIDQLEHMLLNAEDKLVVVEFLSPQCGGCKALHPKICQQAELNSSAMFLKVNFDQHRGMCRSLGVPVLPFFQFYRGAEGRVCSFSCTNANIQKFKDAVKKHGKCGRKFEPAESLEELEKMKLASNAHIEFSCGMPSSSSEDFKSI